MIAMLVTMNLRTAIQICAKCGLLLCLQNTPAARVVAVAIHMMMLVGMNWRTPYHMRCVVLANCISYSKKTSHTLSTLGLSPSNAPFDHACLPKRSSKPPRCDRTRSHMKSRNDDNAIEHPKSNDSTRYSPASTRQTIRKEKSATHGMSNTMRMTWRCWTGFE